MTWPRIVVGAVAVITALGALLADVVVPDLAAQHAFNPAWPPHAKFHDAQYVVMSILLGALGLALVARNQLLWAAALLSTPWLGMLGALLFPGTATYDPEFADDTVFVLGLHGQVFLALVLLAALVTAAWGSMRRLRASA
ncbi:hypothetical protein K1T35_10390 [Pseudonocardia sp. DSM 110487]|jgi:hypothetical protein|uniref:hypothetical protein n=1 Tax=Pseudonocardia sp. DSM 110487 TaxID=2865833 RepID=UPI001C697517|nr:hypothetical protein [Pseudonocardia sp. DSM 110487]QYN37605.1 hypothetical protein K1T35_10390 [Pseudonocardia sp. DSM 110487]